MTSTFCNIPTFLIPIPQETRFQGTQPAGRRRHGHKHGHDHYVAERRRRSHDRGDSGQVGRPKRWRKVTCDIERTSSIVGYCWCLYMTISYYFHKMDKKKCVQTYIETSSIFFISSFFFVGFGVSRCICRTHE